MDYYSIISLLLGLGVGSGIGAVFMLFYTARLHKKKLEAEAAAAMQESKRKKLDNQLDAFETMYELLNKCMADYTLISENYRLFRELARNKEDTFETLILQKREELASLKAKVTYLKGIRCYNTLCPRRVLEEPIIKEKGEDLQKIT